MAFNGSSESHQNNNLKVLTAFAASLGSGGDHDGSDGNKQKAEDDSAAAIADCDDNEVEQAEFAANDIEADLCGSPVGYVDGN
jgi:hypothetical protein